MKTKLISLIIVLVVVLLGLMAGLRIFMGGDEDAWVCEESGWVKHGNPSAPKPLSRCSADEPEADLSDMIKVDFPTKNAEVTSPLVVRGKARGNWFFEASFPVMLVDWDGKIIAQGIAQAKSNWMTTEFVPFETTLTFTKPTYKNNGALILKKDNPSGLPANDAALEVPILFK